MRFPGDEFKFMERYKLQKNPVSPMIMAENSNTDNIKTLIASLSFIYNADFEQVLSHTNIYDFINLIKSMEIACFREIKEILNNLDGNVVYFDEILDEFSIQDFDYTTMLIEKRLRKYKTLHPYINI